MISTKAARTVFSRVEEAIGEPFTAARAREVPLDTLREAGLSRTKASAILALAKLARGVGGAALYAGRLRVIPAT